MALPTSRDVTFVANSVIPSATLNAIQDQIIALCAAREVMVPPSAGQGQGGVTFDPTTPAPDHGAGMWSGSASAGAVHFPLELAIGERLRSVKAWVIDQDGTNQLTLRVFKTELTTTTDTELGNDSSSGSSATVQGLEVSGLTEVVTTGFVYTAVVDFRSTATTSSACLGISYTKDLLA
jgi:hypothetical protein